MIEHWNKIQKHGRLPVGYIEQHNQAAPLSYIQSIQSILNQIKVKTSTYFNKLTLIHKK